MHAKPDLRVFLKWMIARSGSVITDVIWLKHWRLMRRFIAYLLLLLVAGLWVSGIAGITCWGCFPKYQNAWWMHGASSVFATCCIIAITYAKFRFTLRQRGLVWLIACSIVSALILFGIWLSSWLPRIGPPRRGDLFQLVSLIPLLTISLSFTPMLMRIYRGISFSRTDQTWSSPNQPYSEYFSFATQFGAAFALPVVANLAINHKSSDNGFFVLFSIASIFFGLLLLYPLIWGLMKSNWIVFSLISVTLIFVSSLPIAYSVATNGLASTPKEIAITTSAILSGPAMLILFCFAIRLQRFRISMPPRSFSVKSTPNDLVVHPLDA